MNDDVTLHLEGTIRLDELNQCDVIVLPVRANDNTSRRFGGRSDAAVALNWLITNVSVQRKQNI